MHITGTSSMRNLQKWSWTLSFELPWYWYDSYDITR